MAKAGATPARSEASTGGQALSRSGGGNPISGEWAYSEAAVGVGIWSAALMGGTAIGTMGSAGLGTLVGLGSASAGSAAGRGLGNTLAGMLGAGPGDVSVAMPSSVAKGSGQPTGGAGAKGQRGAPGGGVGADRANQLKDSVDQYNRENLLAENGEGGTSGMGGHEGASGTGEAQQMGEMPEWAGDVAMCMVPLPMGSLKLLGRLAARGGAAAVRAGLAGEAAVRLVFNIGEKVPIQIAGRTRIPDGLTKTVLSEVKNVQSLSYTQQLRDFAAYASQNGLRFDLYVRPGAQLSGPLLDARAAGLVNILEIPF